MLGLSLSHRHELAHKLSHDQKLLLSQALALRLELRAPSFPNPLRGIAGILAADSFLKKIGAVGLLNGGLAEAVWNRRRTEIELEAHKDVDVFILSSPKPIEDFEEGIDWWIPHDIHFDSIKTQSGSIKNIDKRFWINGHGCTLCYRIKSQTDHTPGLYFPSPELAVDIRVSECLAMIDDSVAVINEDEETFFDKFREKLGVRTQLPSFIPATLGRNPVPYLHGYTPFRVEPVPLEEQRALKSGPQETC